MDESSLLDPSVFVNEIWKSVVGYEGLYEVSSFGVVRRSSCGGNGAWGSGRVVAICVDSKGYPMVGLWKNNKQKILRLHRILAHAFFGPSELEVNHKDGVRSNFDLRNLEYTTHQQNMSHAVRTGLFVNSGESHYKTKLTDADVLEIRRRYVKGVYGFKRIAKDFGIGDPQVVKIIQRKSWKHI